MVGKIVLIKDSVISVSLSINVYQCENLIGKNVIFNNRFVGEIVAVSSNMLEVILIGEIVNNTFISGTFNYPEFNSECRFLSDQEIKIIYSNSTGEDSIVLGKSYTYSNYPVSLNVNSFFSSHFAIFGNTGSGKSYFVSRLLQGIFYDAKRLPFNTNIFLFDAYGEYQQAFNNINNVNSNLNYRVITTDLKDNNFSKLSIPFWLLGVDDICLLLNVDDIRQISIIEKALKFVTYFSSGKDHASNKKNDIIARALLDIIFAGGNHTEVRNKLTSVLTQFSTHDINLDVNLTKGGWTRSIRQCISIESDGKFADIEIVINYLEQFCNSGYELVLPDGSYMYTINDFYTSLEFALISEGIFNSERIFDYANVLKIRLNSLINSDYGKYFVYDSYINRNDYVNSLLYMQDGRKYQIINFNINHVDDRFAKVIVKVFSKLLFNYIVELPNRASMPFHIVLEEAHRYVQNDIDTNILGYNIFERIAKEGRKYGILLGIISQRPSELSTTVLSQCSNFAVFKMFNNNDINYINDAISDFSSSLLTKLRTLSPGSCILFGTAFKMPIIAIVDRPNPTPKSDNCNIGNTWYIN
ncbi:MAG: DUF87 domain-containing protein [Bacilli bacterium]|nr:DUF87 domain-containing protein [Bacilli bacterium]